MLSPFPRTTIGKAFPRTGLKMCQVTMWSSRAQIFLECSCGESIAILPDRDAFDRNAILDSISDEDAAAFFTECGWTVFDGKGKKTRCPKCIEKGAAEK